MRAAALLALVGLFGAGLLSREGLIGMALGLFAAAFGLFATWQVIQLTSAGFAATARARLGAFVIVLAFLAKLPLYVGAGSIVHSLGGVAPACFLAGVAVVYLAAVKWALARR